MEETLRQLGVLLLGSIPTILLFLVLFFSYRFLVHGPLVKVLAERRERTEGALEKARADIAAAEARTAEYERSLKEARAGILAAREARRQQIMQARTTALVEARANAEIKVKQAKEALRQEVTASKQSLQAESERLASEIIDTLLRPAKAAQSPAEGSQ